MHRRHPVHAEDLDRGPAEEHHRAQPPHRQRHGQTRRRQRQREHAQRADQQQPPRLPHHHQDGPGDGSDPEQRQGQAPGRRSAQPVPGDQRTVDRLRGADDGDDDGELEHDAPQPGPGAELHPALPQVGQQAAAGRPVRRTADIEEGTHRPGDRERRGVHGQHPARAHRGDHRAAEGRSADAGAVHGHAEEGEGTVGVFAGDRGEQHALGRRVEEGGTGAAQGREQHHLPQLRVAGEDEQREDGL